MGLTTRFGVWGCIHCGNTQCTDILYRDVNSDPAHFDMILIDEEVCDFHTSKELKPKKVLVVEDNVRNRRVTEGALKKYGAIVTCVDNGKAALDKLRPPHCFDASFTVRQMPKNGWVRSYIRSLENKFNENIKSDMGYWHTSILVMTADVIQVTNKECMKRLISWQCKKQTIAANSTTEAKYVAAANCFGQVLWIQNQMIDYGFNFMNTKIHIDNESTISVIKNPIAHSRTKHIEIRFHFIRDCYEKRLIEVIKIHTDHNVADLLTKGFDVTRISMDLRMDRCSAGNFYSYMVFKQFWQTATVRTLANGIQQLVAFIDSKEYTITEASVRSKLQLADATGIHNLSNAEIYAGLATLGYVTEGDFVPLLPAMLAGADVDQGEGSAQPAEPHHTPVDPIPSTSQPSSQSPPHSPHHSPHQSPH
ncbi:putative ribonuclease H-like domain-containing protein [Tanacetum coccineum]